MKSARHIILLLLSILLLSNCKKDDEKLDAELVISPSTIFITEKTGKFYLSVQPGYKVDWEVSRKPFWMEITPSKGRINKNIIELTYVIQEEGLYKGTYNELITIKSNRVASATAIANMIIGGLPLAEFNPAQLHLTSEVSEAEFSVKNVGNSTLVFELQPDKDWLTLDKYQAYPAPGASIKVKLTVNRTSLPVGTEQARIHIKTNSSVESPFLSISMDVPPFAQLETSNPDLHFGYLQDHKSMYLINRGNVASSWNLQVQNNYIYANQTNGTLQANDSIELQFTVDRQFLLSETYHSEMHFSASHGQDVLVPVRIDNYIEEKWLIEGYVQQAVYDRNNDYLYMLFDNLLELKRLDPITREIASIPLSRKPYTVSIGANGDFAVVTHSMHVSYVNLVNMNVESVYPMEFVVGDALLANGWIYVFPHSGNDNRRVKCLEISTGQIYDHTGWSQSPGMKAKLHPSGNYFYGNHFSWSSINVKKFDITNGIAHFLYDSYVNSHLIDVGSKFWIADDGSQMIGSSHNILRLTEDPSTDFSFIGQLSATGPLTAFDHSTEAGISLAGMLMHPDYFGPGNFVRKYNNQFMAEVEDIELPKFLFPSVGGTGELFEPECHFIFFNSEGTKAFVAVKSRIGTAALNEWAIVTLAL